MSNDQCPCSSVGWAYVNIDLTSEVQNLSSRVSESTSMLVGLLLLIDRLFFSSSRETITFSTSFVSDIDDQ